MAYDERWPVIPFIVLRGIQVFFSIICLGLSAYAIDQVDALWYASFALTTALLSIIYVGVNFVLLFSRKLLPLATVIADSFLLVFWLISLAGTGNGLRYVLRTSCTYTYDGYYQSYTYTSRPCEIMKGWFAMVFFTFVTFFLSTILASITLYRSGNSASTTNPSNPSTVAMAPVNPQPLQPEPTYYPNNQPQQAYTDQKDGYYAQNQQQYQQGHEQHLYQEQNQQPFVSPVSSPGPQFNPVNNAAGGAPPPPPPPPPPPVGSQELPTPH